MVCGLAAAELVVIHAGQIIVDEAVGVQHLDRAGNGHGFFHVAPRDAAELQHQHGADALAACQQTVAHGLGKTRLGQIFRHAEALLQRRFDFQTIFFSRHFGSRPQSHFQWVRGQALFSA